LCYQVDINFDQASRDIESMRKLKTDFTRNLTTGSLYEAPYDDHKDLMSGDQPHTQTTSELVWPRVQHTNAEDEEPSESRNEAERPPQSSSSLLHHLVFAKDGEHCSEKVTDGVDVGAATQASLMQQRRKISTNMVTTFESFTQTNPEPDEVENSEKLSYQRRHRRNCAALRISTTDLISLIKTNTEDKEPIEEVSILSPEPISPGQQLEVKHSIPQFMKDVPPLPTGTRDSVDQSIGLIAWRDTTNTGGGLSVKDRGNGNPRESANSVATIKNDCARLNLESPAKFKVRVRTSLSETSYNQFTDESVPLAHSKSTRSPARKKLKVKVPGHSLQQGQKEKLMHGTVLKQCNSLADLSHSPRNASLKRHGQFTSEPIREEIALNIPNISLKSVVECDNGSFSSQPSDQFDLLYSPSLSNAQAGTAVPAFNRKYKRRQELSMDYWPPGKSEPKLRYKFSFLKHRVNGRKPSMPGKAREPDFLCQRIEKDGNKTNVRGAASTRSDETKGRVLRWARGARRILRSYVRKTLDGST
jgi:hypothetical protein